MTTHPIVHGSFTLKHTYAASPARVFAAWADIETKARWFIGPPTVFTEQAAFLDGSDGTASREEGTAAHLDRLARVLADLHAANQG